MAIPSCVEWIVSSIVTVHPHEITALVHSSSCFFFILSAYFVILPLRDDGAISLGLGHLPGLFAGSLVLTLVAAPLSTIFFSLPNLSKSRVTTYVVTRPGRELLFTVASQDEKYKAKVCIDVIVQRLGDAAAAGIYNLLFGNLNKRPSLLCFMWIVTAFHLGRRQTNLAKVQAVNML